MADKTHIEEEKETEEKMVEEKTAEETPIKEVEKSEFQKESKQRKEEKIGIAYVQSTSNNTMVHITDMAGNTISRVSGGMVTKHARMKSNPTIAMFVAKKVSERARDLGFTGLYVRMKGRTGDTTGPGAHAAVKALSKEGFNIISILDTTKFPRGGPKKKGGRRGRRV